MTITPISNQTTSPPTEAEYYNPPPNTARLRKVVALDKQGEQRSSGSRGRENRAYPSSIDPTPRG